MIKQIDRDNFGGKTEVSAQDWSGKLLEDVNGQKVVFENCVFSAAIIIRGYFRDATFRNCKFIGCRFIDSNFREAKFIQCDFKYASFDRCVLPLKEVVANLPDWPNVKRDLIQNLRANARAVGDFESDHLLVVQEMEAERDHWARAKRQVDSYYIEHYGKFWQQVASNAKWFTLSIDSLVWGHGFSFLRLTLSTTLAILFLSGWLYFESSALTGHLTLGDMWSHMKRCGSSTFSLYIDLPDVDAQLVKDHWWYSALVVLLRYFSIGLFVTCFYRRFARN
jgi:hypothetical protein